MRKLTISIFLIFVLPASAFAFSFYDVINQTVAGPLLQEQKYSYTPALGISTRLNGLEINDQGSLYTTNRNSYLIGLDINGSYTTLNLPYKDPALSRATRVDSELTFITTSLNITPNFKAELAYEYNSGYYSEENPKKNTLNINFPNLSLERISTSVYYLKNKDHVSFLFSPVLYKKSKFADSSSWIYGADLSRYKINNLSPTYINQQKLAISKLTDVTAYDLSFGVSYSRSWFFQNWFFGGVFGLNYDFIYLEKKFLESKQTNDTQGAVSSLINLSLGHTWTSLTMGVYATAKSWNISIDESRIRNSPGRTGTYLTYAF